MTQGQLSAHKNRDIKWLGNADMLMRSMKEHHGT